MHRRIEDLIVAYHVSFLQRLKWHTHAFHFHCEHHKSRLNNIESFLLVLLLKCIGLIRNGSILERKDYSVDFISTQSSKEGQPIKHSLDVLFVLVLIPSDTRLEYIFVVEIKRVEILAG